MSNSPKVSVLIPTYNSALFLEETIQSVIDQTFTNFEIVVVDNNSTDDTVKIVRSFQYDARVRLIVNESNVGMVGNWNKCLSFAKGEYIKFLMSDNKFHRDLLEKFVDILDCYPNVSLVSSYKEIFGTENWKFESPLSGLHSGSGAIEHSLLSHNWLGEPTTVMFRKDSLWIGGFKDELKYFIDWDMWLRLLKIGDLYVVPEYLSYFRFHGDQATGFIKMNYVDIFERYYYLSFLSDFNFSEFVNDNKFKNAKRQAAIKCIELIPSLRKNNIALAERGVGIARREGFSLNIFGKIVSKLKRFV